MILSGFWTFPTNLYLSFRAWSLTGKFYLSTLCVLLPILINQIDKKLKPLKNINRLNNLKSFFIRFPYLPVNCTYPQYCIKLNFLKFKKKQKSFVVRQKLEFLSYISTHREMDRHSRINSWTKIENEEILFQNQIKRVHVFTFSFIDNH